MPSSTIQKFNEILELADNGQWHLLPKSERYRMLIEFFDIIFVKMDEGLNQLAKNLENRYDTTKSIHSKDN